jgi:hypothetical protein
MTSRRQSLASALVLTLVIILILMVLWSHPSSHGGTATVNFAGFSNVAMSMYAVFECTKPRRDVFYHINSLEQRSEEGWSDVPLDPSLGDVRGVRGFSLFVPVASTNAEYRIRVSFTERALGVFGLRDKFLETYNGLRQDGNTTIYRGRQYDVTSRWPGSDMSSIRDSMVEPFTSGNSHPAPP